jgi:hypothetical protein
VDAGALLSISQVRLGQKSKSTARITPLSSWLENMKQHYLFTITMDSNLDIVGLYANSSNLTFHKK